MRHNLEQEVGIRGRKHQSYLRYGHIELLPSLWQVGDECQENFNIVF